MVVTGTVAAWRAGSQVVYEWGDVAIPSMVVELTDIRVISGALEPGTRSVYVGFISAIDPEQIAKVLPTGMTALAYLDKAPGIAPAGAPCAGHDGRRAQLPNGTGGAIRP